MIIAECSDGCTNKNIVATIAQFLPAAHAEEIPLSLTLVLVSAIVDLFATHHSDPLQKDEANERTVRESLAGHVLLLRYDGANLLG